MIAGSSPRAIGETHRPNKYGAFPIKQDCKSGTDTQVKP